MVESIEKKTYHISTLSVNRLLHVSAFHFQKYVTFLNIFALSVVPGYSFNLLKKYGMDLSKHYIIKGRIVYFLPFFSKADLF